MAGRFISGSSGPPAAQGSSAQPSAFAAKSLYEQLQDNRERMLEIYEDSYSNPTPKALDNDEFAFLMQKESERARIELEDDLEVLRFKAEAAQRTVSSAENVAFEMSSSSKKPTSLLASIYEKSDESSSSKALNLPPPIKIVKKSAKRSQPEEGSKQQKKHKLHSLENLLDSETESKSASGLSLIAGYGSD